eukprot:7607481-Pyramimonas_sp.AAC.1
MVSLREARSSGFASLWHLNLWHWCGESLLTSTCWRGGLCPAGAPRPGGAGSSRSSRKVRPQGVNRCGSEGGQEG